MKYYPIFLDITDRECLVVGGGAVGSRKAGLLRQCGAKVTVISPYFSDVLLEKAGEPSDENPIRLVNRAFAKDDLKGMTLVFAATNNAELNQQIMTDAKEKNIWCNLADAPEDGNFILPAVMARGDLVCAVSTSGASPAMARKIKNDLSLMFGPEYGVCLDLMGNIRKRLLSQGHDPEEHKLVFRALVKKDLPKMIADGDKEKIDSILHELLGRDYSFDSLATQEL